MEESETANMDIKEELDVEIKTETLLTEHETENTFDDMTIEIKEESNIQIGHSDHILDIVTRNEENVESITPHEININSIQTPILENVESITPNVENNESTMQKLNSVTQTQHILDSITENSKVVAQNVVPNTDQNMIDNNKSQSMQPDITAVYSARIEIKEEINMDETDVSYDYPNFDNNSINSIDSADMNILSNVETCLQDEVNIKCEDDNNFEDTEKDYNQSEIKAEPQVSQYTKIKKGCTSEMSKDVIVKLPSEHLNNDNDLLTEQHSQLIENNNLEPFQLNSITGDELSLEQAAYGVIAVKKKQVKKKYQCQECPKVYTTHCELKRHYNIHRGIERREIGIKQGQATRKANQLKKSISGSQNDKEIVDKEKQGYECTCGKIFKRRSTMETCLRSHNLYESDKNRVSCATCTKSFKDKVQLALHRKRLHRKKFLCKFCPTDYENKKELLKHLQIHQKVQLTELKVISEFIKGKHKLQCFMCSKSYSELSDLKIHVMNDHQQPYTCPHCKNSFSKIVDFGNHTKSFHPEVKGQSVLDVLEAFSKLIKSWKCVECELQFLDADKLALHQIEMHSPDCKATRQFQCVDCRRVFVSQKGLTSHRRVHHTVENPEENKEIEPGIMCLECRKICKDMEALTSHMRLHSPDRKYPCKFCDFRFATPEKRKAHAEIHTGDMKFVCFICEYTCSSENRLKKHKMSLKHANMKEYLLTGKPLIEEPQTSHIDNGESSKKKRKKDRDSEKKRDRKQSSDSESEEIPCDICGEKFKNESLMLEHKQIHPFIEFPNDDKPSRIFFK